LPAEAKPLEGFDVIQIGLAPEREALVKRLQQRTLKMFGRIGGGLSVVDEVRGLLSSGATAHGATPRAVTGKEKPFESLGYKESVAYLRGEITIEQAIESTFIETRQYAKRQMTWFRRDPRVKWISGFGDSAETIESAWALLCSRR
jgi:tRNA dimethylallyltransferase